MMLTRKRTLIIVVVLAILVAVPMLIVAYVPGGQLAVRESLGGTAVALGPGFHLRVPLYSRLYRYDAQTVIVDEAVEVVTSENATFHLPIRIITWPSGGDLLTFHKGCAGRDPSAYIPDRVRDGVLSAARQLSADALLDDEVERRIGPVLSAQLLSLGIADDGLGVGRPSPQVVFNAILDYLNRKFPASARRLAENSIASDPGQTLYHAAMGMVLEAEGDATGAEAEYLNSLYLDPAAIEPMSRLYVMYQSKRDLDQVKRLERLLIAAIDKDRSSPLHHHWLGQVYLRIGRADDAQNALQTAIGLAPEEPEFRVTLGGLMVRENRLDEARAAFGKALEIRADHPLALFNLGVTYALEGDLDTAIEYFLKAERTGYSNFALYNSLAQAYEENGDLERAAGYLRRSLEVRPDQPERRSALRRIEETLKKKG